MREHIVSCVRGIAVDLDRLAGYVRSGDNDEIVSAALDLGDRLADERQWLRGQPLSSILDDEARLLLNRYRLLLTIAHLRGEHYLLTSDPADIEPWMEVLGELGGIFEFAELLPE
jgi:hypothetical protein